MPYYFFIWDDENESHLAEHGVTLTSSRKSYAIPIAREKAVLLARPIAFGYTSTGKYLACVYDHLDPSTLYPITAYEVQE